MWKLLTGVIADLIYAHLGQDKLLPDEQKGCKKGSLVQFVFLVKI